MNKKWIYFSDRLTIQSLSKMNPGHYFYKDNENAIIPFDKYLDNLCVPEGEL
jgi:hypothetical protein